MRILIPRARDKQTVSFLLTRMYLSKEEQIPNIKNRQRVRVNHIFLILGLIKDNIFSMQPFLSLRSQLNPRENSMLCKWENILSIYLAYCFHEDLVEISMIKKVALKKYCLK